MSTNTIFIPSMLRVGNNTQLSFTHKYNVTFYDEKNKLRRLETFTRSTTDCKDVSNTPLQYSIKYSDAQFNASSSQSIITLESDTGLTIDVNIDNIYEICKYANIVNGVISEKCVLGFVSNNTVVLPVTSSEYKSAVAFTSIKNSTPLKTADLEVGKFYHNKQNGQELIYVGYKSMYKWVYYDNEETDNKVYTKTEKKHYFISTLHLESGNIYSHYNFINRVPSNVAHHVSKTETFSKINELVKLFESLPESQNIIGVDITRTKQDSVLIPDNFERLKDSYVDSYFRLSNNSVASGRFRTSSLNNGTNTHITLDLTNIIHYYTHNNQFYRTHEHLYSSYRSGISLLESAARLIGVDYVVDATFSTARPGIVVKTEDLASLLLACDMVEVKYIRESKHNEFIINNNVKDIICNALKETN